MICQLCNKGIALDMFESWPTQAITDNQSYDAADISLQPVICNCCGGHYNDCQNCKQGRRVVFWVVV